MSEIRVYKLKKVVDDNFNIKTFTFEGNLGAKPGQFVMVWIPGVDQKPFGVSRQTSTEFDLTVVLRGNFTKTMFKFKPDDKIGISGPFGTSFTILKNKKVAVVGGGCGMAPLGFLIDELRKSKCKVSIFNGAQSIDSIVFQKRFPKAEFCTSDGTYGQIGYATDLLEGQIGKIKPAMVYSCGPEPMLKVVAEICNEYKVKCELSMERYMKCGFGVCGQCVVDPLGIRMCQEGPVISAELSKKLGEFGKYSRDKSGKKVDF